MPLLKRSQSMASVTTTTSMFTRRSGKYQKALGIVNVYIMVSSLIMTVIGVVLMRVFHMDKIYVTSESETALEDLSSYGQLPWLLLSIGVATFILATLGFLFSGMESKPALMTHSVFMGLLVLFQLYFIYVAFNANSLIQSTDQNEIEYRLERAGVSLYLNDDKFRENWNIIQRDMRCCGFKSNGEADDWNTLHNTMLDKYMKVSENRCFPESCCIEDAMNEALCTKGNEQETRQQHKNRCKDESTVSYFKRKIKQINIRGCPEVLQEEYTRDLPNLFFFIEIHGGITILVEVIAIALASAYVAQITRRYKRYKTGNNMELN